MKKKFALLLLVFFVVGSFADDLPRIAVYVVGDVPDSSKRAFDSQMLVSFVNSGRYSAVERPGEFLAEAERKRTTEYGGTINDEQISELGKRFDVGYVCIAEIGPAFGFFQIDVRIVNVETAETVFSGEANSTLESADELTQVLETMVRNMLGDQTTQTPESTPVLEPVPDAQARSAAVDADLADTDDSESVELAAIPREPSKASVYVTGLPGPVGSTLSRAINNALMRTGIYAGMESIDGFVSGAADDAQLISAGMQAGVNFIFVINVSGQIAVRIIDVRAAAVMAQISMSGQITAVNAAVIAKRIVDFILKSGPQPDPAAQVAQASGAGGGRGRGQREREPAALDEPPKPPPSPSLVAGVTFDVVGGGLLLYGIYQNGNAKKRIDAGRYSEARMPIRNRNAAYVVGTVFLLSGISLHIFF
jgi:hypothetical protein